jgi:Tfp pilus assembly protein PilX
MYFLPVRRQLTADQRGAALVFALLAFVILTVLGLAVFQNSVASLQVSSSDRLSKVARSIAEAGAEYARETLRAQLRAGATLNQKLLNAANHGELLDATVYSALNGSTGLANATANTPLIAPTSFASGTFQVFLTNDRAEPGALNQAASVKSTTDANNRIMITSLASMPGGALAAVQEQLKIFDAFLAGRNMPGVLVLPGPSVNFGTFSSNARQVTGVDNSGTGCFPTVAVTTNAAQALVDATILAKRPNAYQSCLPFTGTATQNFLPTADNPYDPVSPNVPLLAGDPRLIRVNYLEQLVKSVMEAADFHSLSAPGFTGGTASDPKIIAIDGDASFPNNWTGAGIILVTGALKFNGGFQYDGLMLAIGAGRYEHVGNGPGWMRGTTFVANVNTPWASDPTYVGIPSYKDDGGGNSLMQYSTTNLNRYAAAIMPLRVLTFQQLR